MLINFLILLFCCCFSITSSSSKVVSKDAILLHSQIATKKSLPETAREAISLPKKGPAIIKEDVISSFVTDPALAYLCKCALQVRTALYNSNTFTEYLREVRGVRDLSAYITDDFRERLRRMLCANLILFLQDALLLVAVSEYTNAITVEERCEACSLVVSLTGYFVLKNQAKIVPDYTFLQFDNSVEFSKRRIEYSPQHSLLGSINAARLLRHLELHRRNVYDLSDLCNFISTFKAPPMLESKVPPTLRLNLGEEYLEAYLRDRVEHVPLVDYLTSVRHSFGYVYGVKHFMTTNALMLNTLLALEQATFQLEHLFPASCNSNSSARPVKESIFVTFAGMQSGEFEAHAEKWLNAWIHAFRFGITEVLDCQLKANDRSIVRSKLLLLKIFFRKDPCMTDAILKLEGHLSKVLTV